MGSLLTTVCFSEDCSDADSSRETVNIQARRTRSTRKPVGFRTTNATTSSNDVAGITGFVAIPRTEVTKQGLQPTVAFQSDIIAKPLPIRPDTGEDIRETQTAETQGEGEGEAEEEEMSSRKLKRTVSLKMKLSKLNMKKNDNVVLSHQLETVKDEEASLSNSFSSWRVGGVSIDP